MSAWIVSPLLHFLFVLLTPDTWNLFGPTQEFQ
jgi:hypothetical protein